MPFGRSSPGRTRGQAGRHCSDQPVSSSATIPSSRSDSDAVSTWKPRATIASARTPAPPMSTSALSGFKCRPLEAVLQGNCGQLDDQPLDGGEAEPGVMNTAPVVDEDSLVEADERGDATRDADQAGGASELRPSHKSS